MKLKYKKMVIMISMCTMGIGLVTFSITRPSDKSTTEVESSKQNLVYSTNPESTKEDTDVKKFAAIVPPTLTPVPTKAPTTEAVSVADSAGSLEKDKHAEVNKLIKKYFAAKLNNKNQKFKTLVNDVKLIDLADIKRKTKYIESYKNIACYTKKGPEEGTYIVYAYHEVKFTGIETLAPAINAFYVKTDDKGNPYIYLGEIDEKTEKYFNEVRKSEDVNNLIDGVNKKMQKALKKDASLAEFYLKLKESAQNVTANE